MRSKTLKLHHADNLWVALQDLSSGEEIQLDSRSIKLVETIPAKHKFNEHSLLKGDKMYLYGVLVGEALCEIPAGSQITTENTIHASADYKTSEHRETWVKPNVSPWQDKTFMGFHRQDGKVGTANYWLVVPLVFCQNRNLSVLREAMLKELGYSKTETYHGMMRSLTKACRDGATAEQLINWEPVNLEESPVSEKLFPNVDGVKFLLHEGGCGGTRDDSNALCALLAGYITHPNVAGVTVMGLGCQHAQVEILESEIHKRDPNFRKPMYVFEQQKYASENQLIFEAMKHTMAGLVKANQCERKPAELKHLVCGVECGGSDGFSGISSNPTIGKCADYLVALGASVMLAEFPELCGVEQELLNRCNSQDLARRFETLLNAYAKKAADVGAGFDMNPSPGNIKDGLITDAIKSAGAAKKGGSSPVNGVLDYTEPCINKGLNLLCTPGNDVESTTALAASGANIILFSTGLGTPTGNPVVPVIKISSNTDIAQRLSDIIDFDTGAIIRGEESLESLGAQLLDLIVKVASGEVLTKSTILGQDDFIPWKRGVSL